MSSSFRSPAASRLECSPSKPWGIHLAVTDSSCPRCGWSAGRRRSGPGAAAPELLRAAAGR